MVHRSQDPLSLLQALQKIHHGETPVATSFAPAITSICATTTVCNTNLNTDKNDGEEGPRQHSGMSNSS
jgi:hypothetical protein